MLAGYCTLWHAWGKKTMSMALARVLPIPFVPDANSESVQKLRHRLGAEKPALRVSVAAGSSARERNCYVNVRDKVKREGGRMQPGWAVWQHGHLFIEAEPHAVYDPGGGQPWIDLTPHTLLGGRPCPEIVFIPNNNTSHDFNSTDVADNVRVALVDDPRVSEALRLFSEKTALMNSVAIIDGPLPPDVSARIMKSERRALTLLSAAAQPAFSRRLNQKLGRNDSCPCGSGKKYKKCCGI